MWNNSHIAGGNVEWMTVILENSSGVSYTVQLFPI